jgi:putative membrane protein
MEHGESLLSDSAPGPRCAASSDFSNTLGSAHEGIPTALLAIVGTALVASGLAPYDRTTWWLEVFPCSIGAPIVVATAQRFPLTSLVYTLLAVHAVILCVGGHYTYAQVPLGFWVQDALGLARNHYDRLGHFAQGFVPASLSREILLRATPLRRGRMAVLPRHRHVSRDQRDLRMDRVVGCAVGGHAADAFLGTQGDVWDTQWDMFLALIGALTAQTVLGRAHDRALAHLS